VTWGRPTAAAFCLTALQFTPATRMHQPLEASFGCKASHPDAPLVQRQVLVVAEPGDVADVHLIAFEMPAR
jgi:hypothetical protein